VTLRRLEQLRFTFDRGVARRKIVLLDRLRDTSLGSSDEVFRLHELLCFLRAYPDDRSLLKRVDGMLCGFAERADLDRHRRELVNSGIAGTEVHYPFFWFTAGWLAQRWPDRLRIDWPAFRGKQRAMLDRRLSMLMPYCETLALEEAALTTREWIETLKGPRETDAVFVTRRFSAMRAEAMPREALYEEMDLPFRLLPGPDTPSNTLNRYDASPIVFQRRPLVRSRETFRKELNRPAVSPRPLPRREARKLIEMARRLMVARTRDLDAFVHADENDVRILDYPEGFQLVCLGAVPARRQMLDAAYGFLMLRNGVLIGYVLSASLFGSAEVAYNLSPAFRGAEATHLYARCLHAVRHLFGADTFMVDPYQMGHDNPEGLRSGAWWFYYKLGFRPRDTAIARLAETEERKVKTKRGYRSSIAKLNRLSSVNMYLHLGEPRDDVIGELAREAVGLRLVRHLAERFGADREQGIAHCSRGAAKLLGSRSPASLPPGERLAWERWAPLVLILPGIAGWSPKERAALARVVRAKGGRRESDFVRLFDRHAKLRRAVFDLSREL